jgi:hypothetical protein
MTDSLAVKHYPQQPYWEGYVKGYEDNEETK